MLSLQDKELSLQDKLDLTIQERRFQDVKGLKAAMTEQSGLEGQLALTIKDERWDDCIRLSALIDAQTPNVPDQMTRPNLPHPHIKIERRSPITHGHPSVISEDTIRASQLAHAYDNPPIRSLPIKQEQSSDIMPDMHDALIARWFEETQLHDREIARI